MLDALCAMIVIAGYLPAFNSIVDVVLPLYLLLACLGVWLFVLESSRSLKERLRELGLGISAGLGLGLGLGFHKLEERVEEEDYFKTYIASIIRESLKERKRPQRCGDYVDFNGVYERAAFCNNTDHFMQLQGIGIHGCSPILFPQSYSQRHTISQTPDSLTVLEESDNLFDRRSQSFEYDFDSMETVSVFEVDDKGLQSTTRTAWWEDDDTFCELRYNYHTCDATLTLRYWDYDDDDYSYSEPFLYTKSIVWTNAEPDGTYYTRSRRHETHGPDFEERGQSIQAWRSVDTKVGETALAC